MTASSSRRWRFGAARRLLRPANRWPLDAWVERQGGQLRGCVLNVGSGEDQRTFGSRTVRVDLLAPTVSVRADVARALPFVGGSFDGVLCTEVLEHVPDAEFVLAEIARVARPGAVLVVTVPFAFHYHPDPADYRRFTPPGLKAALERAGFDVTFVSGVGGKLTLACLWVDSLHLVLRVVVRAALVPFAALLQRLPIRDGQWSDWAANAVAVAVRRRVPRETA
jgi:SAM-dependent methyltransferase